MSNNHSLKNNTYTHIILGVFLIVTVSIACIIPAQIQEFFSRATPSPTPTLTPTPQPTPTPRPLPPDLIETDPEIGGTIPLQAPITMYFNQPMDQSSVENAFSGEPSLTGSFQWSDPSTLVFTPDQALDPGTIYSVRLDSSAKASNGLTLTGMVDIQFRTPQELKATNLIPLANSLDIDPSSAVVAAFNQPITPLGENGENLPPAFSLSPSAPGSGEWVNTSTFIFYPEKALAGGVTYTAQINPDLRSTAGGTLEDAPSWSFTTRYPALLSRAPVDEETAVGLDVPLEMEFNQAMNPTSVEANFQLLDPEGKSVEGEFEWSEDSTSFAFTPSRLYERSTLYSYILPGETLTAGGTPLEADISGQFTTVSGFMILRTDPTPGGSVDTFEGVTLYINSPVEIGDITEYFTLTPEVPNLYTYYDTNDRSLHIRGDFQALTNYDLTISSRLSDRWGDELGIDYPLNFSTAPLRPSFMITFSTNSLFLTPEDDFLPVQGTNLSVLNLEIGTIPEMMYADVLAGDSYTFLSNFTPPDKQAWQYDINLPGDQSHDASIPLNPGETTLSPGLYLYRAISPSLNYNPGGYLLAVSNIQLTLKVSANHVLVWAVDLRTNEPLPGAPIEVFSTNGIPVVQGVTDGEGLFSAELPYPQNLYENTIYAVTGEAGEEDFGVTSSRWQLGVESYEFDIGTDYFPAETITYLYTDRPIYRPGQTVYFKAIHRKEDNGRYSLPGEGSLEVIIQGPDGDLETMDLPLSEYGTAHGHYRLSEFARPGYYQIRTENETLGFLVAAYRKPEIELDLTFPADNLLVEEEFTAELAARYYFDAPAGNVPVTWRYSARPTWFYLPGYQVGVIDTRWMYPSWHMPYWEYGTTLDSASEETSARGELSIPLTASKVSSYDEELSFPSIFTLEVTAEDESGFPVSGRAEAIVHPSTFYIGVDPDSVIARAEEEFGVNIKVVDWDKNPDGVRRLRADFSRVTWEREQIDQYSFEYIPRYELVGSTDFQTAEDGEARLAFTAPEPGTYQLDVYGEGARTEVLMWVSGTGQPRWPQISGNRLKLTTDKTDYLPGETAQVFIPNPFPGTARALLTVERGEILSHQAFAIESAGTTIPIPLTDDDAPNVYISVVLIGQDEAGKPDFREGYLDINIEPEAYLLNVELLSEPERTEPRGEVQFQVRVTDHDGNPVQGEFSLAVVDKAVLALADPNSEPISETFYGPQYLGVKTGIPLSIYAGRFVEMPGGMGGGGGEAEPFIRREFPDTAYWNAQILTDEDGIATVTLTLPDNLTTWQADARGVTQDTLVGQAETEVVTTKDLFVRPVTPRFLVAGDHLQLAAVVHNNTATDLSVEVTLQAAGVILDDSGTATRTVEIPARDRIRVEWWVTVEDVAEADLTFSAQGGGLSDATKPYNGALPIKRYLAPQTFGTSGHLPDAGEILEIVSLPRTFDPQQGSLSIELSPSIASAMFSALDALEDREHLSTISTASHFLPNLVMYQAIQDLEIDNPDLEERLDTILDEEFERLVSQQNDDGGWSWWFIDKSQKSSRYVTAYVLLGLHHAREAGVFVNAEVIDNAVDFLIATSPSPGMLTADWQMDQLAFEHFVLSEIGAANVGGVTSLIQESYRLGPSGKAFLAMIIANRGLDEQILTNLFSDLETSAVRTASGTFWEDDQTCFCTFNNPSSSTAIVLYALARRDPTSDTIPEAVRYLISTRGPAGDWNSAYDTSWAVLALTRVMRGTGEYQGDFSFTSTLNGTRVISGQADGPSHLESVSASIPIQDLYPQNPNALSISRDEGTGTLYYQAHLNVSRPAEDITPFGREMALSRYYSVENVDGESLFPDTYSTGMLTRVHLTLTLEHDMYYVNLEDMIPAGAEILNTRLKTSQTVDRPFDVSSPFAEGWGWWYFNDPIVYDDHITWTADFLPAGTYELTYLLVLTHPGQYQVLPAHAWMEYFPEVQAISAGDRFVITEE